MRLFIQKTLQTVIIISILFFLFPWLYNTTNAAVVINEIYPKPSDEQSEWIELYNTDPESVSLNLWKLENTSGEKKSFIINASSIIQGHGFLIFPKSQTAINLPIEGDTVHLFDATGKEVDTQGYPGNLGYNTTMGRSIDGAGIWSICTIETPNGKNSCPEPSPLPTPSATVSSPPSPTISVLPTPIPSEKPAVDIVTVENNVFPTVYLSPPASPTLIATPKDTFTLNISKSLVYQIVIVGISWILLASIATWEKKKNNRKKKETTPQM